MSNLEKIKTNLKDCYILKPKRFGDARGYFSSVTTPDLSQLGFNDIHQVSNSLSGKGIIRGLHYQEDPYCQAKVVRCHQGAVLDVVVDIRKDSPTYGQYTAVELTPEEGNMLYVPRGFAHGFVSLKPDSLFEYYVDNEYKPKYEGGILWNDPDLNIPWDEIFKKYDISEPLLSDKDRVRLPLKETKVNFTREPKRFLVTGIEGQLGHDIVEELHKRGEFAILAPRLKDMDITKAEQVEQKILEFKPDVIFHCAAMTAVDKSETPEGREIAEAVNVQGTLNIARNALAVGSKLVYVSTDYVFDGKKPGVYTENDMTHPLSVYGETKLQGEQYARIVPECFVARTSWVFGINGENFVKTMYKLSKTKPELKVVCDQIGSPTYSKDLAKTLVEMSYTEKYGTYHVNNEGFTSWADFAKFIMEVLGSSTVITPVTTEEYYAGKDMSTIATRPLNSRLSKDKLVKNGFDMLPSWQEATRNYILNELIPEQTGIQRKRCSKGGE